MKREEQRELLIPYNPIYKVALHVLPYHLEPVENRAWKSVLEQLLCLPLEPGILFCKTKIPRVCLEAKFFYLFKCWVQKEIAEK